MSDPEAEEIEVALLLDAVYQRYGYDLRGYARPSMRRRVIAALARSGLPHLGALQHRLITDRDFFATVLEDLTIQVSEIFRDPEFYRTFRESVVPLLRTYPQLRIWHAGCASGEEVYATATLLMEEGLYERTQIYATDLSLRALAAAKEGLYSADRMSQFIDNYQRAGGKGSLDDYFSTAYGRVAVCEALRKNVVFFQHNLVSDHAFGEMQVIFCRNVLIYFDAELRRLVMRKFQTGLCRGGFLCLGASETMETETSSPFATFAGADRIYRYRGES